MVYVSVAYKVSARFSATQRRVLGVDFMLGVGNFCIS
jgi:hypothetical protein